jgi:hypothetical protein
MRVEMKLFLKEELLKIFFWGYLKIMSQDFALNYIFDTFKQCDVIFKLSFVGFIKIE